MVDPDLVVLALHGMILVLLNTSRRDIQIQILQVDLNRNTSVIEEAGELIDLASGEEEQSADSLCHRWNGVTQLESEQLVDVLI